MKLATLRDGSRDGRLVVVSRSGERVLAAGPASPTLQAALDDWDAVSPRLLHLAERVERGDGEPALGLPFMAPLPRAYEWLDGSAFLSHIELVRRARGAELPVSLETEPLVYQGGSGSLLGPSDPFVLPNPAWGLDLEAELACIVGDVALGAAETEAQDAIRLFLLANDWSYRNLIPDELQKGFGFVISKPATSFAPFAVTGDELGAALVGGRVHLRVHSKLNGQRLGDPDAGEMHFSFPALIAHVAKTRALTAGTLIGSGTVSNRDPSRGVSCLSELRMREALDRGSPETRFLQPNDSVRIEVFDAEGRNVFGSIDQRVIAERRAG